MNKNLELPDGWVKEKQIYNSSSYQYFLARKSKGKLDITATLMQPVIPKGIATRKKWSEMMVEKAFEDLAKILSMNISFLPEPLHYGYLHDRPYLIFRPFRGNPLRINPAGEGDMKKWFLIVDSAKKIPFLLRGLEKKEIFIRELPPKSLLWSFGNFFLNHFHTLITKEESTKVNHSFLTFAPVKMYSAPECFSSGNNLTSKTHVYLYGKFLLELTIGTSAFKDFFKKNPFPTKEEYEELLRNIRFPSPYGGFRTLLLTSLSQDPYYRYTNAIEAMRYLKDFLGEKKTSFQQGTLVIKIDSLTKTYFFHIPKLINDLKKRGIFYLKKIFFYESLPDTFKETLIKQDFKLYQLSEQKKDLMEKTIRKELNERTQLIFVTDETMDLKPFLQDSLPSMKELFYVSKMNPFTGNPKVHFTDITCFLKMKTPKLRS